MEEHFFQDYYILYCLVWSVDKLEGRGRVQEERRKVRARSSTAVKNDHINRCPTRSM